MRRVAEIEDKKSWNKNFPMILPDYDSIFYLLYHHEWVIKHASSQVNRVQ